VKLPAIANAVESSTRTRMIGEYVVIVFEKLEALLMSGLWLGPPKSPHIEDVELPKPAAVIPHQRKQDADEGQNARYHAEEVHSW